MLFNHVIFCLFPTVIFPEYDQDIVVSWSLYLMTDFFTPLLITAL